MTTGQAIRVLAKALSMGLALAAVLFFSAVAAIEMLAKAVGELGDGRWAMGELLAAFALGLVALASGWLLGMFASAFGKSMRNALEMAERLRNQARDPWARKGDLK